MGKRARMAHRSERVKSLRLVAPEDPVLRQVAPLGVPGEEMGLLARRLTATALRTHGVAVAAPQVGESVRLIACADGLSILNPSVDPVGGAKQRGREGCLTFPGRWFEVVRFERVAVSGIHPASGEPISLQARAFAARLWQHENDHLDGLLLVGRYPEVED